MMLHEPQKNCCKQTGFLTQQERGLKSDRIAETVASKTEPDSTHFYFFKGSFLTELDAVTPKKLLIHLITDHLF